MSWNIDLQPELLQAIGHLAVISAEIEEFLHKIYWKHAGLDEKTGPIVTDNLKAKRISEDILKLTSIDGGKESIFSDLRVLLKEFEAINTKRNQCVHWIWEKIEHNNTPSGPPFFFQPATSYQVKRPVYRQSGITSQSFTVEEIKKLCDDSTWLSRRLHGHALPEEELRQKRSELSSMGTLTNPDFSFADLFWPAPWLDKPQPPKSKQSDHSEDQK